MRTASPSPAADSTRPALERRRLRLDDGAGTTLHVARYPRAALGLCADDLVAVVCEGRADDEAGLTMAELATAMTGLGAEAAITLDGGGSALLVVGGALLSTPPRGARARAAWWPRGRHRPALRASSPGLTTPPR